MRAVHITSTLPQEGGVSTHIDTVTTALRTHGVEALVINMVGSGPQITVLPPQIWKLIKRLISGWLLPVALAVSRLTLRRRLRISRVSPSDTIIHAHDVVAALAVPPEYPLVLTVHGYLAMELASDGKVRTGSALWRNLQGLEARAYRRAGRVITVDNRIRDYVAKLAGVEPVAVHNGVDPARFVSDPARRAEVRHSLNVPSDCTVILVARRLVNKNGPEVPLAALGLLNPEMRNRVRMVYAGDGPLAAALRQRAAEGGLERSVTFLGSVPQAQMCDWYQAADLTLLPSVDHEGVVEATSISALEAMAAGVPLIASAIGGLKELITDGETGTLVPQGDPDALAGAIRAYLTDPGPFMVMAQAARHKAESDFSIGWLVDRYVEAYTALMRERSL